MNIDEFFQSLDFGEILELAREESCNPDLSEIEIEIANSLAERRTITISQTQDKGAIIKWFWDYMYGHDFVESRNYDFDEEEDSDFDEEDEENTESLINEDGRETQVYVQVPIDEWEHFSHCGFLLENNELKIYNEIALR